MNPWTFEGGVTVNPPVAFWQKVRVFSWPFAPEASVNDVSFAVRMMVLYRVAIENVGVAEDAGASELSTRVEVAAFPVVLWLKVGKLVMLAALMVGAV
jgi:hypothetical protein